MRVCAGVILLCLCMFFCCVCVCVCVCAEVLLFVVREGSRGFVGVVVGSWG